MKNDCANSHRGDGLTGMRFAGRLVIASRQESHEKLLGTVLDEALAEFAESYADETEQDHASFLPTLSNTK